MKNIPLMMALKARGLSVTKLASLVGVSHCRVSQALNNVPGRGYLTRLKLAPLLLVKELNLVNWSLDGELLTGCDPTTEQAKEHDSKARHLCALGLRVENEVNNKPVEQSST